jgi:hypothetical protein
MKLKGFQNRTFLLLKEGIPAQKESLLLSVKISKRKKALAKEFKKRWSRESRGKKGRIRKGIELAELYKCEYKTYDDID